MARPCDKVEVFVDGELPPDEAEAFRFHLPDCAKCQREMADLMQLKLLGQRHVERAAASPPLPRPAPAARWKRPAFLAASALAAVLAVVVTVRLSPAPLSQDVWLAARPERLLEARLGHPGAQHYQPLAAKMMGGPGRAEELPLEDLARLEKRDRHGLAVAYLVRGDPGLADQALQKLTALEHSPEVDNDTAVALLLKGEYARALPLLEGVLARSPKHPQALWNRGLVLRELGLPLLAARSFHALAELKEPGWSEEAALKAESLQRPVLQRRDRWKAIFTAGDALAGTMPGNLPEGFARAPMARLFFYDAVRSAPSREHVEALLPLARALDARAGGQVLEQYVRRVAAADFSRRAPLARDYLALSLNRLPEADKPRLLEALRASREEDLLLGALVHTGTVSRELERFEALATASADPWLQLLAAHERAKVDMAAARWTRATQTLQDALRLCTGQGLTYRCLGLERELSFLYTRRHQLDAARTHAERGLREARASGEWELEGQLLWVLAQVLRLANDTTMARVVFEEILERDRGDLDLESRAHQNLASIAWQELRVEDARREFDAALATGLPLTPSGAFTLSDLARLESGAQDEAALKRALEVATPRLGPGERAVATHTLGRFFIERNEEHGRTLLWRAIQETEAPGLEEDMRARRARAYSFTSLIFAAGRRAAFEEALELFARERGMKLPHECLLAAASDSERTLFIARGPTGLLLGDYGDARRQPLPERLDGLVPEPLLASLRACPQVEVLARPPLHGRAGLLPPDMAWSYLTRTSERRPRWAESAVHLVVSDVELPPDVSLPRLNAWTPSFGPGERRITLTGTEATPSRVLDAMRNANEIDLVAHGVINEPSRDSYLLLAPEKEGPELGVAQVRKTPLEGAPFVVLAACHAARTAYALQEPLSLPAAFIHAGARGVVAATVEIPDLEAGAFFNAVRERIRAGTAPAVALRDERVRWSREGRGGKWLDSVLLFE
jgi:tetratricopeptide (TPR) repeat protein